MRGTAKSLDRRTIALALAAAAFAFALFAPAVPLERPVYRYLFVLDITQSMNTLDYGTGGRPLSRLAHAKAAIREALRRLPCGSRAGLGVFTEHRTMVLIAPVEVCGAYTELVATLERLDWRMSWAGASEVAKGLYSALRLARALSPAPSVVFVTDGHEAPPVNPAQRVRFGGEPGEVTGYVIGAGGPKPMPIPKFDMSGKPLGYWRPEDVVQAPPAGAPGSTGDSGGSSARAPAQPGTEHLSSVKEEHLRELARETGLRYRALTTAEDFAEALFVPEWTRPAEVNVSLAPFAAALALVCLVIACLPPADAAARAVSRLRAALGRRHIARRSA
ncbi:MAG TPA: vWA domain-containing protein [Burkholderiales bacterium]